MHNPPSLLIPLREYDGSRKRCNAQFTTISLANNLPCLKVALPDDNCVVVLVTDSDFVASLIDDELARGPPTGWSLLYRLQCAIHVDRED